MFLVYFCIRMNQLQSFPKTAVVGGGAAGFFLAISLKEMCPQMSVTIFERSQKVLAKVAVSGGGRCNCTNTFADVRDLSSVYPRGHRLLKRLFNIFDYRDAYIWFERHGVPLVAQDDHCVFPASQSSQTIIDCFLRHANRLGVQLVRGVKIQSIEDLQEFDYVAVTIGGQPKSEGLAWLAQAGHQIEPPVPSLFSLQVADRLLCQLMGTVVGSAITSIPATKFRASGALLLTHWGVSGPAVLRLSSYAARWLNEHHYQCPLSVNWPGLPDADVARELAMQAMQHSQKQLSSLRPFELPQRLWTYLLGKCLGEKASCCWAELSKKDMNRLVNVLCNDTYAIDGRAAFKEEFVTCGGVALSSVSPQTLESRSRPGLFFAGEVLDIDGVTGGFNFQAAWTTAYVVASAIAQRVESNNRLNYEQ